MAKKLAQKENTQDAAAVEVAHLANFKGYDPVEALRDVDNVIALADQAKEDAQPVRDEKNRLKAERGYNMKGFGALIQMRRAEIIEAKDILRTIIAGAIGMGLIEGEVKITPDLVDMMEGASA